MNANSKPRYIRAIARFAALQGIAAVNIVVVHCRTVNRHLLLIVHELDLYRINNRVNNVLVFPMSTKVNYYQDPVCEGESIQDLA